METLADRLGGIRRTIATSSQTAGRSADEVCLIAVSKTHPPEAVSELVEAGQYVFGESRVQEARAKIPQVSGKARWHFIGHLQKNKIRQILPLVERLHGVDSLELARDVSRIAGEAGLFPKVLLEVNVAGESSKHGFPPDQLRRDMEALLALDRLQIDGLMAIPPLAAEAEHSRSYFIKLRALRDELATSFGIPLPELSMGMSGDYGIAVEEGATMVRVGSALFGARSGKGWRPVSDDSTFAE